MNSSKNVFFILIKLFKENCSYWSFLFLLFEPLYFFFFYWISNFYFGDKYFMKNYWSNNYYSLITDSYISFCEKLSFLLLYLQQQKYEQHFWNFYLGVSACYTLTVLCYKSSCSLNSTNWAILLISLVGFILCISYINDVLSLLTYFS